MTLAERIAVLVTVHGSLRKVADMLDIDPGYLSRLRSGEKADPSDEVLHKLGLRRVVTYERIGLTLGKSLLREPLKPGERLVCYCPPGVCQAPQGFSGPCNRAPASGALASDASTVNPASEGSEHSEKDDVSVLQGRNTR